MSDASERAEKAARAKALLRKRQQQKTSGGITDGGGSPRTGSPAPSTPPPNFTNTPSGNSADIQDASLLFGKTTHDTDFGELGVLAAPSPLRPMPSPMALGRAISSPPPSYLYNQLHSPHSPVPSKLERRTSTPISPPQAQKVSSSHEIELHAIRSKYETEIARLNTELKTVYSTAANENETLRNEIQRFSSQAEDSRAALQSQAIKVQELQTSLSQSQEELAASRNSSATQQQTITLLVNEKAALVDQVFESDSLRNKLSESEERVSQVRNQAADLQARLNVLETEKNSISIEMRDLKSRLQTSEQNEQSLREQIRALDVDLQDSRRALADTRRKLEERDNELRIIKEDNRVEVLEQALTASRERVEELGESMNRLQGNLAVATQNGDSLAAQLEALTEDKNESLQKSSALEAKLLSTNEELEWLRQQHQSASGEQNRLQEELNTSRESVTSLKQHMSTLSANLASKSRHHNELELALSTTSRRLADTEASLQALRSENTNLLVQLEEVRPRLVELTNKAAEDEERISSRDRKAYGLEKEIVALETDLHDLRSQLDSAKTRVKEEEENGLRVQVEKEEMEVEIVRGKKVHDELETIVTELRNELGKLKEEKQGSEKMSIQLGQERDLLRSEISSLQLELDRARYASEELQKSEADSNEVLEEMRTELESLREQLFEKDQEVSNLRTAVATSTAPSKDGRPGHGTSPSLSDELFSSLQDQHVLDMSDAHSRIRDLETEVFATRANEHTLQKRITALEDELGRMLRQPRVPIPAEASGHVRSTSMTADTRSHTPSSLSQSITHQRYIPRPIRPRVVYEENLPNDIRRKRKISLGMLKARIESERAADVLSMTGIGLGMSTGSPLSRISSIVEIDEAAFGTAEAEGEEHNDIRQADHSFSRRGSQARSVASLSSNPKLIPRYHLKGWDESHIYWCHACKGDLVVL